MLRKLVMISWDLSNTLSAVGILVSLLNMFVVIFIYLRWNSQKQKEVIAHEAGILVKEMESLRNDIISNYFKHLINDSFIDGITIRKNAMTVSLGVINAIDGSLVYKEYLDSIDNIICSLRENPKNLGEDILMPLWRTELDITGHLTRIRFFG